MLRNLVFAGLLVAPPTFAEKILYIGDSHSVGLQTDNENFMGPKVFRALESDKHTVSFFASGGARVSDYLWEEREAPQPKGLTKRESNLAAEGSARFQKTLGEPPIESLGKLLDSSSAHGVVINLGTNAMGLIQKGRTSELKKDVDDMVRMILAKNARCFWILPPPLSTKKLSASRQKTLSATIEEAIAGRCEVFRSAERLKIEPGSDGIHYGKEGSNTWADAAIPEIRKWIGASRVATDPNPGHR